MHTAQHTTATQQKFILIIISIISSNKEKMNSWKACILFAKIFQHSLHCLDLNSNGFLSLTPYKIQVEIFAQKMALCLILYDKYFGVECD